MRTSGNRRDLRSSNGYPLPTLGERAVSKLLEIDAANVCQGDTWAGPRMLRVDAAGDLLATSAPPAAPRTRWFCPGIPNLHSHAFQRAMAGLGERQRDGQDSFWTWRENMYRIAARFDPDSLRAVAAQLYAQMLEAGYTHVCEFHYLHRDAGGRHYADPAAMSLALIEAAAQAGIGLTLLPTLYLRGGFDDRPLSERQQRFALDVDEYCTLIERLRALEHARLCVGIAFHSLRAVPLPAMRAVLEAVGQRGPIHIHIAEQQIEVDECIAHHGARPVRWLLDQLPVDARWALVHATHCDTDELRGIAACDATVALCPSTEANLGDGLFDLPTYLADGGRFGIGSDSQVLVSPVEELRWLEYGQRLRLQRRNIATRAGATVAQTLLSSAWDCADVCGVRLGALAAGYRADVLELDPDAVGLFGVDASDVLDRWLFCGQASMVRSVWVGGRQVVIDGRHREAEIIAAASRQAMTGLLR